MRLLPWAALRRDSEDLLQRNLYPISESLNVHVRIRIHEISSTS